MSKDGLLLGLMCWWFQRKNAYDLKCPIDVKYSSKNMEEGAVIENDLWDTKYHCSRSSCEKIFTFRWSENKAKLSAYKQTISIISHMHDFVINPDFFF